MTRLLIISMLLTGCAGQQLTEEEREWRRGIDRENWAMCERAYQQAGKPTFHKNHSHQRGRVDDDHVKSDLVINGCRQVLREYWARY